MEVLNKIYFELNFSEVYSFPFYWQQVATGSVDELNGNAQ